MKFKNILIGFVLLQNIVATAQTNLVPNPSFEEWGLCQMVYGYIMAYTTGPTQCTSNWFMVKGSADLFTFQNRDNGTNDCHGNMGGKRIPETVFGFQYARTDSNYLGLGTFINYKEEPTFGHDYYSREWAGVRLTEPLKPGACYQFTMYVSRAEKMGWNVSCLGAYFTPDSLYTEYLSQPPWYISPFPLDKDSIQVLQNPDSTIWDTVGWVPVTGTFRAKGGEQFLYIGNLLKDEYYMPIPIDTIDCLSSYFFIDDVSLYEVTCPLGVEENVPGKVKIYPNPANDIITINTGNLKNIQIELFDISGRKLLQQKVNSSQEDIDVSILANGVYICTITSNNQIVKRENIIIQR